VRQILEVFGMLQCSPIILPMLSTTKLSKNMKSKEVDLILYNNIVGKLFFLNKH